MGEIKPEPFSGNMGTCLAHMISYDFAKSGMEQMGGRVIPGCRHPAGAVNCEIYGFAGLGSA